MCLDELADFEVKQDWGWKDFEKHGRWLVSKNDFHMPGNRRSYPTTQWFKTHATEPITMGCGGVRPKTYPNGFHVFYEAIVELWSDICTKKVYFRGVLAKGKQGKLKVVVVDEIWICEKETDKPPKD